MAGGVQLRQLQLCQEEYRYTNYSYVRGVQHKLQRFYEKQVRSQDYITVVRKIASVVITYQDPP